MTWWAWIVVGAGLFAMALGLLLVWFAIVYALDVYGLEDQLARQHRGEDWPTGMDGW